MKTILINIIGAFICFIIFSIHPFLNWLVDKSVFIMPWWAWGGVGIILFELVFIILVFRS